MFHRLRSPWLAVLLLLASPAFGGQALPLLHPCGAGAAAGHAHGDGDHHGGGHTAHAGAPEPGPEGEPAPSCTCIGSCQAPSLLETPQQAVDFLAASAGDPHLPGISPDTASPRASQPLDLLPPTTAPPLA